VENTSGTNKLKIDEKETRHTNNQNSHQHLETSRTNQVGVQKYGAKLTIDSSWDQDGMSSFCISLECCFKTKTYCLEVPHDSEDRSCSS
jgi:hypothetical protein